MATEKESGNMLQEFKDEFSCCICLDLYNLEEKIPRLLKCSHSFCTKCLVGCLDNDIEGKFRCPLCDVPLKMRSQDVANLQINIYLTNIMEKIINRVRNKVSDKDQNKLETDGKLEQDQQIERTRVCQTHNMDAANFCVTCDSLMCPQCFTTLPASKHINHEIALSKEVFDDKMQKLVRCKVSLRQARALMKSKDSGALMSLKGQVNSLKTDVKITAKDLHTKIDKWETNSYRDLNNILEKAEKENTSKSMANLNKMLDEINEAIVKEEADFYTRCTLETATNLIKVTETIADAVNSYQPSALTPYFSERTPLKMGKLQLTNNAMKDGNVDKICEQVKESADQLKRGHGKTEIVWLPSHVDVTDADTVLVEFILKHPTVQTTFDTVMKKCDAKIDWPLQPHGVIQLDRTLKHDSKDVTKKAKKWEAVAVAAFRDLMKQLNHQKITILQELWDKAKEVIAPMSNQTSDFCELDFDDHAAIVTVVGKADEVDALGQTILALVRQMENDLERSRQKITETVSTLRRPQILMLLALDFHNEMKNRFKDFDIEPNVATQTLKLTGLSSDVIVAKVAMYELITAMISDTISVSSEMAKFVKGNEVRRYLVQKMKTKKPVIKAVWDVKSTLITVFAITQTELVDMKKLMETEVIEKNIDVTDDALPCVKSTAWSNFTSTRIKTQEGLVIIQFLEDKQSIQLITVYEIIELLVEEINNFLKQNTVLENC